MIPRLGLQAAMTSVKVSQQFHQEMNFSDVQEVFWSDSKAILGHILIKSRRFHASIGNQDQLNQGATLVDRWRYLHAKLNPADYASHRLGALDFLSSTLG